ncbi:hypothetical protein B0H17DRAFT_1208488 [Mycena rosella]|uniref:Secreted protein n=1 Tax=Mycena rosella TaxID=1033263 RepID=A0AAD7G9H4_MYCRO|nr:hypothetical protein B0H17DRAFT_1208488 [Mycena rosella]
MVRLLFFLFSLSSYSSSGLRPLAYAPVGAPPIHIKLRLLFGGGTATATTVCPTCFSAGSIVNADEAGGFFPVLSSIIVGAGASSSIAALATDKNSTSVTTPTTSTTP